MRAWLASALFVAALAGAMADDDSAAEDATPRLVAYKELANEYAVEGQDVIVQYFVHNVGAGAADDVTLRDEFNTQIFDLEEDFVELTWERIEAGAVETFNHTVVPVSSNVWHDFGRARVTYSFEDEATMAKVERRTWTASMGRIAIIDQDTHTRLTSLYVREWTTFAVLAAGPVAVPLVVWLALRSSNEVATGGKRGSKRS